MNKKILFVLGLGLALAWPGMLRAETRIDFSALEQRVEKTAFVHRQSPDRATASLSLAWEDKNSSSVKKTTCRGTLLAAKNRVITHTRCFLAQNYEGQDYRLQYLVLSLKNGLKTVVFPPQIVTSGMFAYVNVSASLRKGLDGVEVEVLPGAQTLADVFKAGTPFTLFSFQGEIVRTGHLFRTGQFDLDKWNKEALIGEPLFYQNRLIGMNAVLSRYHYFVKEKPLLTVLNEANGGSGLLN